MLFPQDELDEFYSYNRKTQMTKTESGTLINKPHIIKTKEKAVNEVEAHADPEWVAKAEHALEVVIQDEVNFTSDAIWKVLDHWQIPRPNSPSAMGSILRRAARNNKIRKTGRFIPSTQSTNHQRDVAEWEVV